MMTLGRTQILSSLVSEYIEWITLQQALSGHVVSRIQSFNNTDTAGSRVGGK